MSLHTTQEWHQQAAYNVAQAQQSSKRASRQCDSSRRAHEDTVHDNLAMYNELHMSLEQKVRNSQRIVDKLQKRAESVEASIQQTKLSHGQLEMALRAKDGPLQLCMWRMEQRERRPLRELVRDNVEVALEVEKSTLVDVQRKLLDAIKRTKAAIGVLEGKLDEVNQDVAQKVQALGVDEMCLRTTNRSFQTVVERSPEARSASSSRVPTATRRTSKHDIAIHESTRNEVARQQEAVRLSHSAANREEAAKVLREENMKLISRCDRAVLEAAAKTERALHDRITENQQMRRRLEGEIRDTQQKIDNTKSTLAETRSQMRALEEPMELCSTCTSWRKQRATREHINDPVTTKLQEHQMTLFRSHEELRGHHQSEKYLLQELTEQRDRLKEDHRDKTAALQIDMHCLTHEAAHLRGGKSPRHLGKSKMQYSPLKDSTFDGAFTSARGRPRPEPVGSDIYGAGRPSPRWSSV